jgi:cytochrome oxidase assembly protein ShyY1
MRVRRSMVSCRGLNARKTGEKAYEVGRNIATRRSHLRLPDVAPYFIDTDATPNAGGLPVGGPTVVLFPNNHLQYALPWFALALMLVASTVTVAREEWKNRRRRPGYQLTEFLHRRLTRDIRNGR